MTHDVFKNLKIDPGFSESVFTNGLKTPLEKLLVEKSP